MASAPKANAIVSQSGGPTGVINASLVGVIEEAKKYPEIKSLYGSIHAVSGIVKEHFIDLMKISNDVLETVAASPSSALGSSRDKPDAEYCKKILDVFKKRDIRYFFYIGGNDSANTCYIINNMAVEAKYELRAFHVPKTIDNDLLVTDHCPGFGTAAKFVACALMGDDLDNRALPGIKIDVIMGRHAGFLTAAAALGKQRDDDGPHLVYLPERPVSMDKFLSDVDAVYKKLGRCVIAVSEGMSDHDHKTWAEKITETQERDSHGNVQLSGTGALADYLASQIKEKLKVKRVRADTFGYLQRSFAGLQSPVDASEARWCGRHAVQYAMKELNGSVAMKRTGTGKNYGVELFRTELKNVAEKTKSLPDEYINKDGNGITPAFVEYAMPLTGGLPKTEYLGNMPKI
ncbi:MAG: 6-phosphofructokinase [Planctomycetes bacterium GWF2_41_51]|nr:MAG: 6-phosphofructokinase [Planctomycetes bacterium GWF2_41_51]HBG28503.1 6-phosphofructokinase [Phycisphaerales bacterium]